MPKSIRILRVLNRFNLGGPIFNVVNLSFGLAPQFETLVVGGPALDHEADATALLVEKGINYTVLPSLQRELGLKNDWRAYQALKQIIKEYQPDIVHTHASKAGALGRLAARSCNVPCVVHTFHGHVLQGYFGRMKSHFYRFAEKHLATKTDAIVAISPLQKKELSEKFRVCKPEKITVIPLGFELDKFLEPPESSHTPISDSLHPEFNIAIIGRLVPIKNHELFLRAFKNFLDAGNHGHAFVIGDGPEGNFLRQMVAKSRTLQGKVFFTSWIENIALVLPFVQLVALSSHNEGTPVSLIEAQAAGIPVVATNVGGVADTVAHEVSGLLCEPKNELEMARAMGKFYQDKDYREKAGNAGRKLVIEKHDIKKLTTATSKLYRDLITKVSF